MNRADLIQYLASSAEELVSSADSADSGFAVEMLREATELLSLGARMLARNDSPNFSVITKEAA